MLCSQIGEQESFDCKRRFVVAFANSGFSMLGVGTIENPVVKLTLYVRFFQNFYRYLSVKGKQFAQ